MNAHFKINVFFLTSLFLHGLFFSLLFLIDFNNTPPLIQPPAIIAATLASSYSANLRTNTSSTSKITTPKNTLAERHLPKKSIYKKSLANVSPAKPEKKGLKKTGLTPPPALNLSSEESTQNKLQLLDLLHAAIEAQQHYPPSALEMQREGRVTVTFILFNNGKISNLTIQHSSGTRSLDEAAIEAVNRAVPFQNVTNYLKNPENFQIDIVFNLT